MLLSIDLVFCIFCQKQIGVAWCLDDIMIVQTDQHILFLGQSYLANNILISLINLGVCNIGLLCKWMNVPGRFQGLLWDFIISMQFYCVMCINPPSNV